METAKLFQNGKKQAVRLPKVFQFVGDRVYIKRLGNAVVLLPYNSAWDNWLESLTRFSADFMSERTQPPSQEQENAFPRPES